MSRRSPDDFSPSRFMCEVRAGEIEYVSKIIDEYGIHHLPDWLGGYSLVRMALKYRQAEMAKMLLNKGASIDAGKHPEPADTLLHSAAALCDTEIVDMLLDRGANINAKDSLGRTPLHYATNHSGVVRLMLARNATVHIRDNRGSTALSTAIENDNLAVVEELLNHFRKLNDVGKPDLNSLLCEATEWSNEAMVKLLLRDTTKVRFRHHQEESPLHWAAKYGQHEMIKLFVDRGANINMLDKTGRTVLDAAIQSQFLTISDYPGVYHHASEKRTCRTTVKTILSLRPDVRNEVNRDTLSRAITRHHRLKECELNCWMKPIVDDLLCYGLTVRRGDATDGVFIYEAIKHGQWKVIDAVLKLGVDVNAMYAMPNGVTRKTLLHIAVVYNEYEVAKFLITKGADVKIKDSNGVTPLWDAIGMRHQKIAKMLMTLTSSTKVTEEYLCHAARNLCSSLVKMITEEYPHIDVNWADAQGITALHWAVIKKCGLSSFSGMRKTEITDIDSLKARFAMVEELLSAGASVNSKTRSDGVTALHYAAANGYDEIVEMLLKHGADANCREQQGLTPIFDAARTGNRRIVQMLLDSSADVNSKLPNGKGAVHAACESGYVDVVKCLCLYGCDLNARDSTGATPLHVATFHGHSNTVQTLLKFGANVNAKNLSGKTPLHLAAFLSWSYITMILLANGADTHAKCNDSALPIAYAEYDDPAHEHAKPVMRIDMQPDHDEDLCEGNFARYHHTCIHPCREEIYESIQKYQLEAVKMMTVQIGDSDVTFHDILTHSMEKLLIYARKQSIVEAIISNIYDSEFPLYRRIVKRRFKEALKRNDMLLPALASLDSLTCYILPIEIREKFVYYLSNEDMQRLISASHCDPPAQTKRTRQ